jgi:PAS domain S-box-containing protein
MTSISGDPHKQTEHELQQSLEIFRLMVESVQDYSIYMLDVNGVITSWNIGAERAKGYRAHEIIGKNFSSFYSEHDIQNKKPQKNLQVALNEGHCLDEGWRYRKDGSKFWASVVITAVKDKTGKLIGFAKVTRDMTERRQAETELERKVEERTRELEQKNKELEQFAYVASHDLQEPLRMVATYVDLLNERCAMKLNKDEHDFIQYALDGAERAQQLIRDLLEFSQAGNKTKNVKPTDLNLILKQVLQNLRVVLEETKAEIDTGPLPTLNVDETQIFQLLQNLVSNALKYKGQDNPKIKISAHEDTDNWTFTIQDNGIGIAPEYHQRIFELFQRLHGKSKYPGTGLGLAICKKIIERHDGKIWVESNLGKGAAFKFSLPKGRVLGD